VHKSHILVLAEDFTVLMKQLAEFFHLALLYAVDHLQVRHQRLNKVFTREQGSVRDLPHQ
jgi:hypothetical protein